MNAQSDPLESATPVSDEDQARANFYALIARLFYAAPDEALLAAIAATGGEVAGADAGAPLPAARRALAAAAAAMDAEAAQEEYDRVFIGTGKAEITLYVTHYLLESKKENVLAQLRSELAELGLARAQGVGEYEDHFSSLCEVMRHLILFGCGDAAVQKQQVFFMRYLAICYAIVCDAIVASPNTNFYKHVARFAKAFIDVEVESYDLTK